MSNLILVSVVDALSSAMARWSSSRVGRAPGTRIIEDKMSRSRALVALESLRSNEGVLFFLGHGEQFAFLTADIEDPNREEFRDLLRAEDIAHRNPRGVLGLCCRAAMGLGRDLNRGGSAAVPYLGFENYIPYLLDSRYSESFFEPFGVVAESVLGGRVFSRGIEKEVVTQYLREIDAFEVGDRSHLPRAELAAAFLKFHIHGLKYLPTED